MANKNEAKVWVLMELMKRLAEGEEIYAKDEALQEELGISYETLNRYLKEIHARYEDIVYTEKVKVLHTESAHPVTIYRVPNKRRDIHEIFAFFLEYENDLEWLLQLVHENDPTLLEDLNDEFRDRLAKVVEEDGSIYYFVGYPFERMSEAMQSHFRQLKRAVKFCEYRRITHYHKNAWRTDDVACLKLLFSDGNWYLAAESTDEGLPKEDRFMLIRIAFIKHLDIIRKKGKEERNEIAVYPEKLREKYEPFIRKIQNAMTLYRPFKTAKIRATPKVARYFQEGMKRFFLSQKFVAKHEDGSVDFTIDYTQPLEILPFVKRWAPDLIVLEPAELREEMARAMQAAWKAHRD